MCTVYLLYDIRIIFLSLPFRYLSNSYHYLPYTLNINIMFPYQRPIIYLSISCHLPIIFLSYSILVIKCARGFWQVWSMQGLFRTAQTHCRCVYICRLSLAPSKKELCFSVCRLWVQRTPLCCNMASRRTKISGAKSILVRKDYVMNTVYVLFVRLGLPERAPDHGLPPVQQVNGNEVKRQVGIHRAPWLMEI